jgi:protein-tyrosine phosphatase
MTTRVLFVCMGNICRSPTAEGVFRTRAAKAGVDVDIDSAGTHAYHVGEPPDRRSQVHAKRRGYDLAAQRARQVAVEDFEHFDLILAMDRQNLAALQLRCASQLRHKVKLFLAYSEMAPNGEVPDPYYGGDAGFERVLDLIEDASDGLIRALEALAETR